MKILISLLWLTFLFPTVHSAGHTLVATTEWVLGATIDARDFKVGETLTFEWEGNHNVFIHPSGDCTEDGAIEVGSTSPASYTFTEADVGAVVFACDIGSHCESGGMIMTANVAAAGGPADTEAPATSAPTDMPSGTHAYANAMAVLVLGLSLHIILV